MLIKACGTGTGVRVLGRRWSVPGSSRPLCSPAVRPLSLCLLGLSLILVAVAPQPFPFLIPPLPASLIASHIFASLDAHESTDIYKPWYTGHVWVLKGVTSWMRDAAQWLTAADEALVGMRKEGKQE